MYLKLEMVIKPITLFILLTCIFSFILSEVTFEKDTINYPDEKTKKSSKSISYEIKVMKTYISSYLIITVKNLSKKNQMVTLSTTDSNCIENRKILGTQANGPINLFFPKTQIPKNNIYLCIQCLESNCQHETIIKDSESCQIELGQQYSYYVEDYDTTKMTFEFDPSQKSPSSSEDAINTMFWVKGEQINSAELTNKGNGTFNIVKKQYSHGYIFRSDFEKSAIYSLEVKADVGDYVTVGSLYIENGQTEEVKPNSLEVMGIVDNQFQDICFPIKYDNKQYLARFNGVVYTKKAVYYFKNNNDDRREKDTINAVINEVANVNETMYFCVKHFNYNEPEKKVTIFSFQLTTNKIEDYNYNQMVFPPQLSGVVYGHTLFHDETAIFLARKPKTGASVVNFNMKAVKGFPDMLFSSSCITFPDCNYGEDNLDQLIDPAHSNRMTLFNYYLDEQNKNYSPISSYQPLLVVRCLDASTYDQSEDGICVFETSIYSDKDPLYLLEGQTYSEYLLEYESNLFAIDIEQEEDLDKIYLDLIVFSGDVFFDLDSSIEANKYFLSNKIFYSIHVKNYKGNKVEFSVTAQKKSFYLIQYQLVRSTAGSGSLNIIESGVNYIESVYIGEDADYYKDVDLLNFKKGPYLASFYSQNCKFIVTRYIGDDKEQYVALHDYYGQVIIDKDDIDYEQERIRFKIEITTDDLSEYNKKQCMLYVTGLELSNSNTGLERDISVSEGVPNYFIFSQNYSAIKYSYHISDTNNTLVIKMNLIDKAPYTVTIRYGQIGLLERKVHRNEEIIIYSSDLQRCCQLVKEVCNVRINIELENKNRERRLETTVYQINGAPIYLEKNVLKQDVLLGSVQKYYYLDIGKNEEGDITVDYKRGSGYIYAKVVKKDIRDQISPTETEWRGKYVFPKSKQESLHYETYLKKIYIQQEDTKDCDDGCYILITIENSVDRMIYDDEEKNLIPYRITITPRVFSKIALETGDEYYIPKVKIHVNDFIVGDLIPTYDRIFHFYEVTLPFESDYIYFDWQSDSASLFVNVGDGKPSMEEAHFKFYSVDHDTVFNITREEIINKAKEYDIELPEKDGIRNVVLTIGIWATKIDSIDTSIFAFKIFMPPLYKEYGVEYGSFDLIHVRSDQKVQCSPFKSDDLFVCYFAVIFDGSDTNSSLVVYPKAHNESAKITFIGSMVEAEQIERNNVTYILDYMNEMKADFHSFDGKKYLYKERINKSECLLFLIGSESYTIMEVLSSTYTYLDIQVFVPNPSTAQIFAINTTKIMINFETSKDLLINIVGVDGGGYFNWDTEKEKDINYYIYGFEDRLTLTSGTEIEENRLSCLVAQSATFPWSERSYELFVFYVTFYPRSKIHNMDQVKAGRSVEINYREVKFPLNFYTRLTDNDLAITFTFYNYYLNMYDRLLYDKQLLKIWGRVITEETALDARFDINRRPKEDQDANTVYGVFDGHFATLFLNSKDISKFGIDEKDKPTLFFTAEMADGVSYDFNGAGLELSLVREQSKNEAKLFAPEYVYLNGKLLSDSPKYKYKLRTDPQNPYMQVEFSSNNYFIIFCIGIDDKCYEHNEHSKELEELEDMYINGRNILTFKVPESILEESNTLYMVIYYIEDVYKLDSRLANYVFKYMNGKAKDSFFSFPQDRDLVEYEMTKDSDGTNYKISFYPIDYFRANYYVKGVYRHDKIDEEVKDTIAISESEGTYLQVDNPQVDSNGKINLVLEKVKKDIAYIKVLAKVEFESIKEFILYSPIDIFGDEIITDADEITLKQTTSQDININTDKRKLIGRARNVNTIQNYRIKFDKKNKISNYIKVETISKDTKNQILYFSPTSEDCKTNRKQLGQSGRGPKAKMWLKKEQLLGQDYLYASVQCQDTQICNYDLEITSYEFIQIESTIFVYNYYVSKENKVMSFRINNTLDISETSDQVLTLYATGGKKIGLSLSHCLGGCEQFNFTTGAAITTKIQKHNYFELKVTAEEGDYISIGSKITHSDGKSLENTLNPNEYQFTGYLKRDLLKKECYTLPNVNSGKSYYLAAIFYNSAAEINFKDSSFKDISKDYEIVTRGFYSYVHNNANDKRKYICVGFPRDEEYSLVDDLPYSLQLTDPTQNVGLFNIYVPQLRGIIYPRITPKGSVVFFNAANLNSDKNPVIYNMLAIEGYPKMYMYKCTSYPFCEFDYNSIDEKENIIKLNEINRGSNWFNVDESKNNSPIEAEQYVMVVKCEDLKDLKTDICHFQTSIFGRDDNLKLVEGQPFSQYLKKGDKFKFNIDFTYEKAASTKIHLDTLVANGEVNFKMTDEKGELILYHEYYLANKIYFSIPINERFFVDLTHIIVHVEALQDSYYSVEYRYIRNEREESTNDIYEGVNNIIPVPLNLGNNEKTINIHNTKLLSSSKYLTSFNSLNCRFDIERTNKNGDATPLKMYGSYAQDVISGSLLEESVHSYQVKVKEKDSSVFVNNMCMVYINSLQITEDKTSKAQKDILISDGVPQKMIFVTGINRVRYIYPNADPSKNIAINFKVISPANYTLTIIYNHKEGYSRSYSKSEIIYLDNLINSENCLANELCNIILEIELTTKYNDILPMVETTIRQINNIPYYIPKEVVTQDFLPAKSKLYLFTTLGKDDQGYVTVNFARGSGLIYAKIVPIYKGEEEKEQKEENPDWRNYTFPKNSDDSLYYDFYNKKLVFSNDYTMLCDKGCYLFIAIEPSVKGDLDEEYRFYQFSISISLTPSGSLKQIGPILDIDPEEYVVGTLSIFEKAMNKDMYEFYRVSIFYATESIEIDWQSDAGILLVNVGDKRPTIDNHHFIFNTSRSDTVFRIKKEDILKIVEEKKDINEVYLTLGVYTEDFESVYGTVYSFRVHFMESLNINKVTSDQKTLCEPEKIGENQYRCLFMIIYNELDFINDLMIYSRSQSPSAITYMYGKYIDDEIYDSHNMDLLRQNIPDNQCKYNTEKDKTDFIFLTSADIKSHFYVSVISNEPNVIEFLSSMKTFDKELSPNPSTIQLFAIHNEKNLKLKFLTKKGLYINIVSLYGNAKITLEKETNDEYNLRGRDDRLALAIPFYGTEDLPTVVIENLNYKEQNDIEEPTQDEEKEKPGFAFYVEYYLRGFLTNIDEINLGKTTEVSYRKTDFPLYYYSKLANYDYSINIFFNLHDIEYTNKDENNKGAEQFSIKGSLIDEKIAYKIKREEEGVKPNLDDSPIVGIYDPALKAGQVYFSVNNIKTLGNSLKDKKPTLYLSIEKTKDIKYNRFRLELTAFQENSNIPITEKLYQYGKIYDKNTINYYKLKVDNSVDGYMRVQFASNNANIGFAINNERNKKDKSNYDDYNEKEGRGKKFITFKKPKNKDYIYLNVFLLDKAGDSDIKNNHYAFKYINSEKKELFFEYEIENSPEISVSKGSSEMTVKFNRIKPPSTNSNAEITYFVKVIKSEGYVPNEIINTISLTESKAEVTPVPKGASGITVKLPTTNFKYVQVIGYIKDGPINEYVSYNALEGTKAAITGNKNLIIVIIITLILLVVVIILIVVIVFFNAKNKDLMEKVNKISFVTSDAKPKEDTNLLMDDNELK